MKNITGKNELTITAAANEVYKISYETSVAVDIINDTGGDVYVNSTGTFTAADGVSDYLLLAEGASYNGYRPQIAAGTDIYIKANAAGKIGVVVKGY